MTDFQKGQNQMRDIVISMCVGFQNEIFNKTESQRYQAYQKVIDTLEEQYGKFMSKGKD
jgi:hypothetical protein